VEGGEMSLFKTKYFISYSGHNESGEHVEGRCELFTNKKIKSIEDINRIEKSIRENGKMTDIVIINFIKL
jgi:hypothetical protein